MSVFTIYSKPLCPACDQAKALLSAKGLDYDEVVLDVGQPKREGASYILREDFLGRFPGVRTVPQIVDSYGTRIGGFTELAQLLN